MKDTSEKATQDNKKTTKVEIVETVTDTVKTSPALEKLNPSGSPEIAHFLEALNSNKQGTQLQSLESGKVILIDENTVDYVNALQERLKAFDKALEEVTAERDQLLSATATLGAIAGPVAFRMSEVANLSDEESVAVIKSAKKSDNKITKWMVRLMDSGMLPFELVTKKDGYYINNAGNRITTKEEYKREKNRIIGMIAGAGSHLIENHDTIVSRALEMHKKSGVDWNSVLMILNQHNCIPKELNSVVAQIKPKDNDE